MLIAMLVEEVSGLCRQYSPLSRPILPLEAVVLVDQLPDKLR